MPRIFKTIVPLSPRRAFRREIATALLVKFVLLSAIAYLTFHRAGAKPAPKAEIADIFAPSKAMSSQTSIVPKEKPYDIR